MSLEDFQASRKERTGRDILHQGGEGFWYLQELFEEEGQSPEEAQAILERTFLVYEGYGEDLVIELLQDTPTETEENREFLATHGGASELYYLMIDRFDFTAATPEDLHRLEEKLYDFHLESEKTFQQALERSPGPDGDPSPATP